MTDPGAILERLGPVAAAAALCGLRILPAALLSPFLGGPAVPAVVRLAVAFGLGAAAAVATGAQAPAGLPLLAAAVRELATGVGLGLAAALPFEAARAGGRLADTLRGATLAELHVAPLRQRETALGDFLVQWTAVLGASAGADRLLLAALLDTFRALPAGAAPVGLLDMGLAAAREVLAAGICMGAPAAAGVLAADLALAVAGRAAPALGVVQTAQPARAALGLLATAVAAAALAGRLVQEVALSARLVGALHGGAP